MIQKIYRIPDMHCPNCSMLLESIEDDLEGIRKIKASYHKQTLVVEFDETILSEQTLLQAIQKKHYTPVPLE
jgi:copper chaperone CopZ